MRLELYADPKSDLFGVFTKQSNECSPFLLKEKLGFYGESVLFLLDPRWELLIVLFLNEFYC